MLKQKIKVTLISKNSKEEAKLLGTYDFNNQTISYQETNNLLTQVIFEINSGKLIRDNVQYHMEFTFIPNIKTQNIITFKDINQNINIDIITNKYIHTANLIEINYTIIDSNEKYVYKVEYDRGEKNEYY